MGTKPVCLPTYLFSAEEKESHTGLERHKGPVHTKDDNYKYNDKYVVLKIVLGIKE